jgi:hypothetical protein
MRSSVPTRSKFPRICDSLWFRDVSVLVPYSCAGYSPCCLGATLAQSIIEEEGGLSGKGNNGADSARQSEDNANMAGGDASARSERSADTGDQSNWDQPLIVAEPDVKVR